MAKLKANKRVTVIGPRSDMTLDAFHAHWSGPHAALARHLPGLVWYVQNHVLRPLISGPGPAKKIEGIAETAFRDPGGIDKTIESWDRLDELREDEARFLGQRLTSFTILRDAVVEVSQRRVVACVTTTTDAPRVSAARVAATVDRIRAVAPCHAEETAGGLDAADEWSPDWFIYVELPGTGHPADLLAPQGPVMGPLSELGAGVAAYLVAAEAKRQGIELLAGAA